MNRISKEILAELDGQDKEELEEKGFKSGDVGTIDFIKQDGTRQMFPYSQLITTWTEKSDEHNLIKLFFSTHHVSLKGFNLSTLYELIRQQNLEILIARDERYLNTSKDSQPYVIGIEIEWKGEKE
ncbi:hypothetical protein [Gracilimonas sediminicola]|uniref:Uncharacterized protein n=1 Tax=Gracilimonas sediminicola TaxID=2952158 RepID=A0A9X2L1E2_9BACT|nr:hypothetical protein [Gracilimonas sediminicola]MCP9290543.1 hypothetical protein [Gracilimonas sediminicola]